MQVAVAGTGARAVDGSTNVLPVGAREQVHAAWQLHAWLVDRALRARLLPGLGPAPGAAGHPLRRHLRLLPRRAAGGLRPAGRPTSTAPTAGCSTSRPRPGRWPRSSCADWTAGRWTRRRSPRGEDRTAPTWLSCRAGGQGDPEGRRSVARSRRVPGGRRPGHAERCRMSALSHVAAPTETELEFDRQVDALVATGLPERLDLADGCFRAWLEPLRDQLPAVGAPGRRHPVRRRAARPARRSTCCAAVHTVGGTGFTTMEPRRPGPVPPAARARRARARPYLLLDVDAGRRHARPAPGRGRPSGSPPPAGRR